MTRQERFKRFSCHKALEDATKVADFSQQTHGNHVRMIVVDATGYYVVFNTRVESAVYDELKALPVVYEAFQKWYQAKEGTDEGNGVF